jgi:hypothetical protein
MGVLKNGNQIREEWASVSICLHEKKLRLTIKKKQSAYNFTVAKEFTRRISPNKDCL